MAGAVVYHSPVFGRTLSRPGASFSQTRCGLILTDPYLDPLYANLEACRILNPKPESVRESLKQYLAEISIDFDLRVPFISNVISGRRHYICRVLPLEALPDLIRTSALQPAIAFLFERSHICGADFELVASAYRLTPRELETLTLLTEGLTSKEIGVRMKVSPNTVKAFLRSVMSKMGVRTRTELMKRFLDHSYLALTPEGRRG